MEIEGRPLLYWCLEAIHEAGIEEVLLTVEDETRLDHAKEVAEESPYELPSEVILHEDPGLGATGLPYQVREHLDDQFFFEFGHHLTQPSHYQEMDEARTRYGEIVVSHYECENPTDRPEINLGGETVILSSPYLLDQRYIQELPRHDFEIDEILFDYLQKGDMETVENTGPIEPDLPEEFSEAAPEYREIVWSL